MSAEVQLEFLENMVQQAVRKGATHAEAVAIHGASVSAEVRLGKVEHLERAESGGYGLRVLVGQKQAFISASDYRKDAVAELVERAIDMARATPEDPYITFATPDQFVRHIPELELYDATPQPSASALIDAALRAEAAALDVSGVTNSEGGSSSYGDCTMAMVFSNGFSHHSKSSSYGISAAVLAASEQGMEVDYAASSTRFASDLRTPESIGKEAGERAIKRLNARKIATERVPVIFDPRVSRTFVGLLASALNGTAIVRGTSFLKDKMHQQILHPSLTIKDDPHRRRGLSSCGVDSEGMQTAPMDMVKNGVLMSWFLDLRTAKQLGMTTTGHAGRGVASAPSPSSSNLYMEPGVLTPEQLIAETGRGLYVTELSGTGINLLTGDFSQGACGFWIENGVLTYPVSEITIADTLDQMYKNMTAANDLVFHYSKNAPTVRVESMMVAGL